MTAYAYLAKGLSLYRMGEYDHALEVYQDLLNKFPESSADGQSRLSDDPLPAFRARSLPHGRDSE